MTTASFAVREVCFYAALAVLKSDVGQVFSRVIRDAHLPARQPASPPAGLPVGFELPYSPNRQITKLRFTLHVHYLVPTYPRMHHGLSKL